MQTKNRAKDSRGRIHATSSGSWHTLEQEIQRLRAGEIPDEPFRIAENQKMESFVLDDKPAAPAVEAEQLCAMLHIMLLDKGYLLNTDRDALTFLSWLI